MTARDEFFERMRRWSDGFGANTYPPGKKSMWRWMLPKDTTTQHAKQRRNNAA